ncbi:MAG: hypothetical protein OXI01_14360 [Albidovulum sp.]|nr:hypothetical protein [Albidovulum sp.]
MSVSEPLSLSIRTAKLGYAIGEPAHAWVTAERDCKLAVYNIRASGAARQIFTNRGRPDHPVAGGESLLALCTSDAEAALGGAEAAFIEQLSPKVGERESLNAHVVSVIAAPNDIVPSHGATARAVAAILVR